METVSPSVNFPSLEERILAFWKENKTFKKSLQIREGQKPYLFYDGPPFATGLPHYGHLLAGTIKDIIPRYHTMKGRYVERRFGWDTHGLPIEMIVEKELGLKGRLDVLEYGVAKFNEACRSGVLKYVDEWEQITNRLGRWIDFENDYKTMDLPFMESCWWCFKKLWDDGRVFEQKRVMPYSWRLSTPLSNFEAGLNYKDVQDPAITVKLRLRERPDTSFLIWTTTPWTMPSNYGACVGPEIEYSEVENENEKFILATSRVEHYFGATAKVIKTYIGKDLVGKTYTPPFDFYGNLFDEGAFRIVSDSYVTTEDGTGIVHLSSFGEDDYRLALREKMPAPDPVDEDGSFIEPVGLFKGINVKEADPHIVKALKERGVLLKHETITHSYPFCYRSDTPLIYKAIPAWYIKVEDQREAMVENNNKIHWVPEHIKQGRFGNWLKDARDWNISRNRFWGNPIPIWKCTECKSYECVGSKAELESKSGKAVNDLHKHFVDQLTWKCASCTGEMVRIPEVLDCWYESGSMPYAQLHYPFENQKIFQENFPADFIAEGLDQTRGWFYTLMVLSTSLFKDAPFKNVIVNGMILAEDGKKMSKSLKNYPDPSKMFDVYGADALRLYMINSPAVRAETLRFSENGVKEIVRSVLIPFWNVYSFFTTYAKVDNFSPKGTHTSSTNNLDKWILSRLQTLLSRIEKEMAAYKLYAVVPALLEFLEELTNWYVRRSRRRFWSDDKTDKQHGYDTMYTVLLDFSKALAPFLPFVTEEIYRNLRTLDSALPESVHLNDYPQSSNKHIDQVIEHEMRLIQTAVTLGRALRAEIKIPVRQPLASITIITRDASAAHSLATFGFHIKEELNVKEVLFSEDEASFVDVKVKPNFPVLGPKFGKRMGEVSKTLLALKSSDVSTLEDGKNITILGEEITLSDVTITRTSKGATPLQTKDGVTVLFDMNLSTDLIAEGKAREFVNRVQKMRKEADLHISDRIVVSFASEGSLSSAIVQFSEYIQGETLALSLDHCSQDKLSGLKTLTEYFSQTHEIDQTAVEISILKSK